MVNILKIQAQSVSRWETNSTMPDIGLLPDIASLFDISVDELLGGHDLMSGRKVENCLKEADAYYHTGEISKMIEVLENGIKDYPFHVKLELKLVEALFSFCNGDRTSTCRRIITLGNQLIDKIKNIDELCSLYQILAYAYLELGNYDQAKVYALKLPSISYSRGFILSNIETGNEKVKLVQANIFSLLNNIVIEIFKLSNIVL